MEDGIANVYYMDDSQVIVENADNAVETDGVVWHDDYTEVVEYHENNISLGTSITEYETATEDDNTLYYSTVDTTLANDEVGNESFVNKTESDEVRNVTVITYESHGNESILPHVSEEAERPVEETNPENNGEVITVGEDEVMLYQIEGSEDLYAVQIADDGQGNLQKYQYKVRETEDGQLEAVPGTIQLQTVDETPEISENSNDNAAVQEIDTNSMIKIENEERRPKIESTSVNENVLQENNSIYSDDSEEVTTDVQTNLKTETLSASDKQVFEEVYVDRNQEIGLTFQNNDCVIDGEYLEESVAPQETMNNSIEISEYMQAEQISTQDESNGMAEPTENVESQLETSNEIGFETEKNNEITLQTENYVETPTEMCSSGIEDVTQIDNNDNMDPQDSSEEYIEEMETTEEVDSNQILMGHKTEKQYAEGSQVHVLADVVIPRKVIEKPMPPKTTIKYSLASHVQKRMKQNLKQECHMPVSEAKFSFEPKFQKMSKNIPVYNKVCKKDESQSVTLLIVNPTSKIKSKETVLTATKPNIDLPSKTENRNPRSLLRPNNLSKKEPIVLNKMQTIDASGKCKIHKETITSYNLNIPSSNEVKCRQPRKQTIKPVERGDSEITFHIDQKQPDNNNIETFDLSDEECEPKPKQRKKRKNAFVEKVPKKRGRKPVIVISDSSEGESNDNETEIVDDVQIDKTKKKSRKKIRYVAKNKNLKKKVEDVKNDVKNFFGFSSGSDSEEQSITPQSDNENKKTSVEENHELSLEEADDSPLENSENLLENGQAVSTEKSDPSNMKNETIQDQSSIKNGSNNSPDLQRITDNEKSQNSEEATEQLKTDEKSDIVLTEMKEIHGTVSDSSILDNVICKNAGNLQCTADLLLDLENSPENKKPKIKSSQLDDSQNTAEKLNDQKNTDLNAPVTFESTEENKSLKKSEIIDNKKIENNKLENIETLNKKPLEVKNSRLETKSKLSNKYACPHCPKMFTIPVAFKMHVRSHGNKDKLSFKCDVCPKVFFLRSAFVLHKRSHSRADIVKNHKVGMEKLDDKKSVESNNFKCDKCPDTFLTSSSLNAHKIVHKKVYKCNICFQKFMNKSKLILHSREHIKNNLLKIVTEDASKRNLRRSTQNKTEFSKIIQNIETTDRKRRSSQSMKKEDTETTSSASSSPDLHTCNICSKSFRQLAHLVMHRDAHNKPKCPNCGKIFGFKNLLDEHLRRHCLKQIALRKSAISGTNKHDSTTATRKSIISEEKMSCNKCDETFKNSADYCNHVKTHRKTFLHKEMKCGECSRSFKSPIGYYSHIRIHRVTKFPASRKSLFDKTEKDSLISQKSLQNLKEPNEDIKAKSKFVNKTETINNKKIENSISKPSSFIKRKSMFSKPDEISSTKNQENLMQKSNTILGRKSTFMKLESSVKKFEENMSKDLNKRKTISKLEGNTTCQLNDNKNENGFVKPRTILIAKRQSVRKQIPSNKVIAYNCSMCDLKFTTHTGLFKHARTHEDSFRCEYCDIVFDSKNLLSSHLKSHISVMFNCGTCNECFKSNEHLRKHMVETKHDSLNNEAKNGDLEASAKKIKLPKKKLGHGGVPLSEKMHKAFAAAKVKT